MHSKGSYVQTVSGYVLKLGSLGCLDYILSFGDPIWVILVGEEP